MSEEEVYNALEDIEDFQHPKYLGNGMYEIIPGVLCGKRLVDDVNYEILN